MAERRKVADLRREIASEREELSAAVGELRAGLAELRAKRLRVVKGALAGALALVAARRLRRRR